MNSQVRQAGTCADQQARPDFSDWSMQDDYWSGKCETSMLVTCMVRFGSFRQLTATKPLRHIQRIWVLHLNLRKSGTTLQAYKWRCSHKSGTCADQQPHGIPIAQSTMVRVEKSGKKMFRCTAQQPLQRYISTNYFPRDCFLCTLPTLKTDTSLFISRHGWHDQIFTAE
jgi:hypothetical protein